MINKKKLDENIIKKIKKVTLLILDVDGVLTDGRIIIDDLGNETKNFDVRDGHGLKIIMRCGIDVALLTGRQSKVVEHRANELGIKSVHQNAKNKIEVLETILSDEGIESACVAYVGDDLVDVPVFKRVGFSAAVADASEYAKEKADYVTQKRGGRGAIREVCEMILQVQDKWHEAVSRYGIS